MAKKKTWIPGEHTDPVSSEAKEVATWHVYDRDHFKTKPMNISPDNPGLGSVSYQEAIGGPWEGPHEGHKPLLGRYVHLFKGFHDARPDSIDMNILGQHWTLDPQTAENYAVSGEDGTFNRGTKHTVLEGRVLIDHLMSYDEVQKDGFAHEHMLRAGLGGANAAKEVPIRQGKPIHILATHLITTNSKGKVIKSVKKDTNMQVGMTSPSKNMIWRNEKAAAVAAEEVKNGN